MTPLSNRGSNFNSFQCHFQICQIISYIFNPIYSCFSLRHYTVIWDRSLAYNMYKTDMSFYIHIVIFKPIPFKIPYFYLFDTLQDEKFQFSEIVTFVNNQSLHQSHCNAIAILNNWLNRLKTRPYMSAALVNSRETNCLIAL